MAIKLEVGKKYWNRRGDIVDIVREIPHLERPFFDAAGYAYPKDGIFILNGCNDWDLIEEVIEEPVKKPHKWAEDLAEAAGILSAHGHGALSNSLLAQANVIYESRKPKEVPQWRKDLAQAIEDGKVVEVRKPNNGWQKSILVVEDFLNPDHELDEPRYRIKPEPKPDVVEFYVKMPFRELEMQGSDFEWVSENGEKCPQVKVVFDGETGRPKSAEVLK